MKVRVVKDRFCGMAWRAEPEVLHLGGVGAACVEKLEFELPPEWDGMAVTLHIEQEGGVLPQPVLLDKDQTVKVDGKFTAARQGAWMLLASDGEGLREMTRPGKYVCYQTLEDGEGTGADGPVMALQYQYLQLVLEQEARAALAAQTAEWCRQQTADRCAAKERALLLQALAGMRYAKADAWDMLEQLAQRWNSPPPERQAPAAVEKIKMDSAELVVRVGESCTLKAALLPAGTGKSIEWMALPEGMVQLRDNVMTALKGGNTLLTAMAGGKMAQRPVQVLAVALDKLVLDKQTVSLKAGGSAALTAALTPTNSTVTTVNWKTDNTAVAVMKDVATTAANGRAGNTIIALKDGSCTVTASAGGKSAACTVKVEKDSSGSSDPGTAMYAVSNRLTGMTSSRSEIVAEGGKAYTAVLTPDEGCWFETIKVTMGGEDVTQTAWDAKTMTVAIASITGNIIITAVARLPMLKQRETGTVVKLVEKDGAAAEEFIVAAQSYEKDLNATERTLLLRKRGIAGQKWNTTWATYDGCLADVYLNETYLKDAPQKLKDTLEETKFYYTPGYQITASSGGSSKPPFVTGGVQTSSASGSGTVTTLSRKVFLPSSYELGFEAYGYTSANSAMFYHNEGTTFEKAEAIGLAMLNADAAMSAAAGEKDTINCIWLRTPDLSTYGDGLSSSELSEYLYKMAHVLTGGSSSAPTQLSDGSALVNLTTESWTGGTRKYMLHPALALPGNVVLDLKGNIVEVREE